MWDVWYVRNPEIDLDAEVWVSVPSLSYAEEVADDIMENQGVWFAWVERAQD